jgi:hypothetical protein
MEEAPLTTWVVEVAAPGGAPRYHRLGPDGSPTPVPAARLPPRVRACGAALHAWASGRPPPPGGGALAPALLDGLPRAFPLRVALVVGGAAAPTSLH